MEERRNLSEEAGAEEREAPFGSFKDAVATFTGLTGVFVAFLWLAGRVFVSGHFRAIGIPRYLVDFSVWEYAETAWLWVITYALLFVFLEGVFLLIARYVERRLNNEKTVKKLKEEKRERHQESVELFPSDSSNSAMADSIKVNFG